VRSRTRAIVASAGFVIPRILTFLRSPGSRLFYLSLGSSNNCAVIHKSVQFFEELHRYSKIRRFFECLSRITGTYPRIVGQFPPVQILGAIPKTQFLPIFFARAFCSLNFSDAADRCRKPG
jgi:hypothetical protein